MWIFQQSCKHNVGRNTKAKTVTQQPLMDVERRLKGKKKIFQNIYEANKDNIVCIFKEINLSKVPLINP